MDNVKIRTEDVDQILDTKISATSAHAQLNVIVGEFYDSVLTKIAARSPNANEKAALDAATAPSAGNPYVTESELTAALANKIPWVTIGLPGSGSDFEGVDQIPFALAFVSGATWFHVREGTFNFTTKLTVPAGFRITGASAGATILQGSLATPLIEAGTNVNFEYLQFKQNTPGSSAVQVLGNGVDLFSCIFTGVDATVKTVLAIGRDDLKIFDSASTVGFIEITSSTNCFFHGLLFDADPLATRALLLTSCSSSSVTGSIFKVGPLELVSGTNLRIVANHFVSGVTNTTPVSSVLLRANTPNSNNNDSDDFVFLLSYIGSPSLLTAAPTYSNNFAGPQGEDLTARAGSLDALLQMRFEERNFHLYGSTGSETLTWDPILETLTYSGDIYLRSSHKDAPWVLAAVDVTALSIPSDSMLYYTLDRLIDATPVTLTPVVAATGSVPLNSSNRQHIVLAINHNGTLWWRGGGGSRFPATGGLPGVYFVDGTSKGILDILGAPDYNSSSPAYTNNFAGLQGDSLTQRNSDLDALTQRLFEYSNVSFTLSNDVGSIQAEPGTGTTLALQLAGTFLINFPHTGGGFSVTAQTWEIEDGEIVYFEWDQGNVTGSYAPVTGTFVVADGSLPLPDDYPTDTKYFLFARRVGDTAHLWDGTELPITGGQWPRPVGVQVVVTAAPGTLPTNTQWDGTDYLWEQLSLAVATGIDLDRNIFPDQVVASPGLTDLADGEGLLVTHTWNPGSTPNFVTVAKVALPLANTLQQNQFIWVQRQGSIVIEI